MNVALFYHSIVSDWNNGNAHFLRGIVTELLSRGHNVQVFESRTGWSLENLVAGYGRYPVLEFSRLFGDIRPNFYDPSTSDLEKALEAMDLVIVHEWNDADLVRRIGRLRSGGAAFKLLFHDTHHRCFFSPQILRDLELEHFDGVLAFGEILRQFYLEKGFASKAWTWHEAADVRIFFPHRAPSERKDLVWIGNWGDDERSREFTQYLLEPVRSLGLRATVFGVRYPREALDILVKASIPFAGWLPNYRVPETFAGYRVTIHIPRGQYVRTLKGIPTIRPFEAMACGIPLICTPWEDTENLFTAGKDYLVAHNAEDMKQRIRDVLEDKDLSTELAAHARATIRKRHTCAHRVDELIRICAELGMRTGRKASSRPQGARNMAGKI